MVKALLQCHKQCSTTQEDHSLFGEIILSYALFSARVANRLSLGNMAPELHDLFGPHSLSRQGGRLFPVVLLLMRTAARRLGEGRWLK